MTINNNPHFNQDESLTEEFTFKPLDLVVLEKVRLVIEEETGKKLSSRDTELLETILYHHIYGDIHVYDNEES